ncbi:MAG: hypothetical protein RLZ97_669 [Verrucomicrobiota bacterium]
MTNQDDLSVGSAKSCVDRSYCPSTPHNQPGILAPCFRHHSPAKQAPMPSFLLAITRTERRRFFPMARRIVLLNNYDFHLPATHPPGIPLVVAHPRRLGRLPRLLRDKTPPCPRPAPPQRLHRRPHLRRLPHLPPAPSRPRRRRTLHPRRSLPLHARRISPPPSLFAPDNHLERHHANRHLLLPIKNTCPFKSANKKYLSL